MRIPAAIEALVPEVTAWRQHLHAHPELGYEEHATQAFLAEKLKEFGVDEVVAGMGGTGVVGLIRGRRPGNRAIGLRADIDALPITELTGKPYASTNPGRMHACGHDGHTAMLLGAAKHLAATRDFAGSVVVIFQPAEEGGAGAKRMLEDGLFQRFPVEVVYGLHNWPQMPVGTFAMHQGPAMAGTDEIRIELAGKGCHAAMPNTGIDPIVAAAQLVSALQNIISRETDPMDRAVLSVTAINAGTAFNVVPDTATLKGTVRTFRADTRERIIGRIRQMVEAFGQAFGVRAELHHRPGYPPTINHPEQRDFGAAVAAEVVGAENVVRDPLPSMGGEDFSFMLEQVPGAYIWMGIGGFEEGRVLHNARYDFNDAALPVGMAWWTGLVDRHLAAG
ncbi:M20 aminoacylase family protein [Geminicoccus harenae]|uniref:M20 aminoacylase family protein n=1 Tax=Geminicoccus harenae TaxID=2498453 RepID=UPI00168B82E8|nr:M20 aminoacylase family protein [Geminicoccus harenae]